ncbi:hypothetical protein GW17_00058266, partial [Ensete ventricosum]
GSHPLRAPLASLSGWPWLQPAAPLQGLGHGLAVGGRPCMGAGRGWSPLLLTAFAAKTQQERVERFYAI